ncbi:EamA-like transporter family protein [Paraperlucidibaca baekdonensis]|uniref:EamA-like transporter family protein n=1 Tax=Paraperlucidibaca baekdonensis TaxID=748120 RepID=A0A3E0H170_9GAMM|nr:DMT family transporter [Paraperlucidibaca baekdonensis]REH36640.1 EamA-like transporter family protein [Paraperlucidibaca baekdonensis]
MRALQAIEKGYLFALTTVCIWSGFVIISRVGGQSPLTPFDVAALRTLFAAAILLPWWLPRLLNPAKRKLQWYQSLSFALLAGISYPLFAYGGFHYAPANHGAVLIAGTLPFFTTLFALMLLREMPSLQRMLGLALIISGVTTLFVAMMRGASWQSLPGDLMFLAASLCWSLFAVLLRYWQTRAFDVTLGVVAFSLLVYVPVYVVFLPKALAQASWGDIALQGFYQGGIVVCVAMWTFAKATELLGAVRVAVIMSAVPVAGTLLAVAWLGELLTPASAMGLLLTFLGALIGALARAKVILPATP